MAILETIRVKLGWLISVIIGLALLFFIIDFDTLVPSLQSMSSKYDVGKIGSKSISYTDFQADLDRYSKINQIMTGSSVMNEQQQQQMRDAAWQELVDRYLFIKNANAAGVNVGKAELLDLTMGQNVSPIVANNPFFADETGAFSPENVRAFVNAMEGDESGQYKLYWNYMEQSILTMSYYSKYGSLLTSSQMANALTKADAVKENNTSANIRYVAVPYDFGKDTLINVSANEIKAYYRSHKKMFRQKASADAEYVVFEVVPSEDDIIYTNDKIAEVYDEFKTTDNMKAFLLRNSDRPYSEYWYKNGELKTISAGVDKFVSEVGKGTSQIIRDGDTFRAVRVMEKANVSDSVYVRHILLQGADAASQADSLLNAIRKGEKFATVAATYSADKNSAADGVIGNIGWMTQTYMIPGFESVITANLNKPYIINTRYGTHIVEVTRHTAPIAKKRVAILEKESIASKETYNKYYSQANRFASISAGTIEGYRKAVDSLGVYSHNLTVNEATSSYGAINQAKEVTRWIFDAKDGKASNIITVDNRYFIVAAVQKLHKEGYKSVEEVSPTIRQFLFMDKRREAAEKDVAQTISGLTTLEEVAKVTGATISNAEDITFAARQTVEPALAGAVAGTELNVISSPIAASTGVYVFEVSSRQQDTFYTEQDVDNLESQKAAYNNRQVLSIMMDDADVQDNRARFF